MWERLQLNKLYADQHFHFGYFGLIAKQAVSQTICRKIPKKKNQEKIQKSIFKEHNESKKHNWVCVFYIRFQHKKRIQTSTTDFKAPVKICGRRNINTIEKTSASSSSSSSSSFPAFIHSTLSSSTYKKYIYLEFVIGFGFMNEKSFSLLNAHKTEKNFILCIWVCVRYCQHLFHFS